MSSIKVTARSVVSMWGQILCILHLPFFSPWQWILQCGATPFSPSLLSADFLVTTHLAPQTISLSFLLTKLEGKPDLTYFFPSPGTSLSIPKQWHLCRALDQWTLSSGDFNHINTTAEENPSDSPLLKRQTQQFCQLLQLLLVRLICLCA